MRSLHIDVLLCAECVCEGQATEVLAVLASQVWCPVEYRQKSNQNSDVPGCSCRHHMSPTSFRVPEVEVRKTFEFLKDRGKGPTLGPMGNYNIEPKEGSLLD